MMHFSPATIDKLVGIICASDMTVTDFLKLPVAAELPDQVHGALRLRAMSESLGSAGEETKAFIRTAAGAARMKPTFNARHEGSGIKPMGTLYPDDDLRNADWQKTRTWDLPRDIDSVVAMIRATNTTITEFLQLPAAEAMPEPMKTILRTRALSEALDGTAEALAAQRGGDEIYNVPLNI